MAILTPSQLTSASNATYFDNATGSITPDAVRTLNDNWISSSILVSQTASLNVLSASYAGTASLLLGSVVSASYAVSASQAATASFYGGTVVSASYALSSSLAQTASFVLNAVSASRATSALNADTASFVITAQTASYVLQAVSSSLATTNLYTASVSNNVITFTEGDGTTFSLTVATGSGISTVSASYALSASQAENATLFNSLSSSQFAQLTTNNTFTGNNVFNQITASLVQVVSASIEYLNVIYETASVIYSSGSNQFGDASDDVQTLWGTVDVKSGPLLVTGSARITGSLVMAGLSPIQVSHVKANDVQGVEILTNSNVTVATFGAGGGTGVTVVGQVNAASFAGSGSGVIGVVTSSLPLRGVTNIVQQVTPFIYNVQYGDGSGYNLTMSALSSSYAITAGSASYAVTSSLALTNIYTASVSNNTITFTEGDGTTFNLTVATGSGTNTVSASFATTASFAISASFASTASFLNSLNQSVTLTGSFNITGSSTFSGSVNGLVVSQSIASQTSSLDFGSANFFTSAVSASTFFNITNPKAGETVNLLLTTVGVATASFSSNVKQVSGSRYTPTSGSGKNDIITFISWDGTSVYLANVKNLV